MFTRCRSDPRLFKRAAKVRASVNGCGSQPDCGRENQDQFSPGRRSFGQGVHRVRKEAWGSQHRIGCAPGYCYQANRQPDPITFGRSDLRNRRGHQIDRGRQKDAHDHGSSQQSGLRTRRSGKEISSAQDPALFATSCRSRISTLEIQGTTSSNGLAWHRNNRAYPNRRIRGKLVVFVDTQQPERNT